GIKLLQKAGIQVVIISGKTSPAVTRRAAELGIEDVAQGTIKKVTAMREFTNRYGLNDEAVAYVGDDLPDIPMFRQFGFGFAVADASEETRNEAHWVLSKPGGRGAVREAAECILKAQGHWDVLLRQMFAD